MKYYFFIAFASVLISCNNSSEATNTTETATTNETTSENANSQATSNAQTTIEWLDPAVQDLGKAKEGQILEISWRFKNTGNAPLVFTDVRAGCGCTVAERPEQPVAPGEEGVIKAKFDTNGQVESQFKQVFVSANNSNKNGEGEDVLGFRVQVEKKQS